MKRLLLSSASQGISALSSLVPGETRGLRFLFVPTAAGPGGEEKDWVQRDRRELDHLGCDVTILDLRTAEMGEVEQAVGRVDGVFLSGGNAFLLLRHVLRSGFAEQVVPLVDAGSLLYVGTSAGAVVAGPGLIPEVSPENRAAVPELESTEALGLVDVTILPHDQEPERSALHDEIVAAHPERQFVRLTDERAVLVRGAAIEIVDASPLA